MLYIFKEREDLLVAIILPLVYFTELTELIYSQNAKLVVRQVLPVMWHLLAGKPPGSNDVKEAIVGLCECLFNTMGHDFVNSAASQPPQSQRRLDQILQSRSFS